MKNSNKRQTCEKSDRKRERFQRKKTVERRKATLGRPKGRKIQISDKLAEKVTKNEKNFKEKIQNKR